jgi:hypothetical protein
MKFVGKKVVDSQSMFSFVEKIHHLPTKKKRKVFESPQGFFWKKLHKITIFQEIFFLKLPYLDISS